MALQEQPKKMETPQTMNKDMGSMLGKNFAKADEVRDFPKGKVELIKFGEKNVARTTLQPGWKWSTSVKEIAKTESCQVPHFQYHISGTLHVKMDDGKELEFKAGEVSMIPPGHDAWVVGNEPVVLVDFQGMTNYAKPGQEHTH
jgi:hypothetical protein